MGKYFSSFFVTVAVVAFTLFTFSFCNWKMYFFLLQFLLSEIKFTYSLTYLLTCLLTYLLTYAVKTQKVNIIIEFCIFELVLVPTFSWNWKFWFSGPNLPTKNFSGLNQRKWTLPLNSVWGYPHGKHAQKSPKLDAPSPLVRNRTYLAWLHFMRTYFLYIQLLS